MTDGRARALGACALVAFVIAAYFMGETGGSRAEWDWRAAQREHGVQGGPHVVTRVVQIDRSSPPVNEVCETCHFAARRSVIDGPVDSPDTTYGIHPGALLPAHPVEMGCASCHGGKPEVLGMRAHGEKGTAARSCLHCHGEATPHAPRELRADVVRVTSEVQRGAELHRDLRCGACHDETPPFASDRSWPLEDLDLKMKPEWLVAWLSDPRTFAPHGSMPDSWPRTKAPDALRDSEIVSIAAALYAQSNRIRKSKDARLHEDDVQGRANVVGASADEGARLYAALGCAACHRPDDAPRAAGERDRAPSLSDEGRKTTEDFLAFYLLDPSRWDARTKMPSFRLDAREAASLAKYLVTQKKQAPLASAELSRAGSDPRAWNESVQCNVGPASQMTRADCGQLLLTKYGCAQCHSLASHDAAPTKVPRGATMPDYGLSVADAQAIDAFVAARSWAPPPRAFVVTPREEDRAIDRGAELVRDLSCTACHRSGNVEPELAKTLDDARRAKMMPPSLDGEGTRARPEWLFSFLMRPGASGVRPVFHPEWAWGKLPPLETIGPRMPSFALSDDDASALVRFFVTRDGGSFPYTEPRPHARSPEERATAFELLNHGDDKSRCTSCHFSGDAPRDRMKDDPHAVAPSLSTVRDRRRLEWVVSMLPSHDASKQPITEKNAELVADVLFTLGDRGKIPRPGEEARAPQP